MDTYVSIITIITHVIERHTMKHSTQSRTPSKRAPKQKMVGLRLEDDLMAQLAERAEAEQRPLAAMARILVMRGLQEAVRA